MIFNLLKENVIKDGNPGTMAQITLWMGRLPLPLRAQVGENLGRLGGMCIVNMINHTYIKRNDEGVSADAS